MKERMILKAYRVPKELWLSFKAKYGKKADKRIRELMASDLQ